MSTASEFEKILPVSKKTRIVSLLKDAIASGRLASGDPIVENKLAQELGVGQGLVREALIELEHEGYQFEAAEASFDLLVKKCAGTFTPHFERIKYHVEVESEPEGNVLTESTVKIRVGDEVRHEVAEGDGPVNALDAAMRKALNGTFPNLRGMSLVDYKVRVINSQAGTAARVRVVIESCDEHDSWGTVGVSENVIEASWIALADSIEYKLYKDATALE